MFKHLFNKDSKEEPEEVTQTKEDSFKATIIEVALQDIIDNFNVNLNTVKKETKIFYPNHRPKPTKVTLETLDNHTLTLKPYSEGSFNEHRRDIALTIDGFEIAPIPYTKVAYYLSSYGVTVKDKFTIMPVVKQLQTAFTQETTTFVEAPDRELTNGMLVPGIVRIIDKEAKTILATVVIVHRVTKVKLPQLDDYIVLGGGRIDPKHVQEFIDTFIH